MKLIITNILLSILMVGCTALEVLVEPRDGNPSKNGQSASTSQAKSPQIHPRQLDRSNEVAGRGYCNRYGRKRDPNPWTTIEFVVNKDVDVAYTRIMSEFGYVRFKPQLDYLIGTPICDVGLRHLEIPGVHYQMRNFIKHTHGSEEPENTIEVDLAKEDVGKVRIKVSYYSGNTKDKAGYEASLRNRVEQALR